MQAKDIPDTDILVAALAAMRARDLWNLGASRWDIHGRLGGEPPEKVVLAKLKALTKRGLLSGCYCGCRGDFEITERGFAVMPDGEAARREVVAHRAGSLPIPA